MTGCAHLSDRMPLVALERSAWSGEEAAHLAACADCRAEWELVRAAATLGTSTPPVRDPASTAAAVLRRLAADRVAARSRSRVKTWLAAGLAAAAVAIVAVRVPRPSVRPSQVDGSAHTRVAETSESLPAAVAASLPLPELEGVPEAQLESILGALDATADDSSSVDGPAFDDVDGTGFDGAFATWEG